MLSLWFTFALISYSVADSCIKVCDFEDADCLLKGLASQYKAVKDGLDGEVWPMDPLNINYISGRKGPTQYAISNVRLNGYNKCELKSARLNATELSYVFNFYCPELRSIFYYRAQEGPYLDYQKKVLATAYDYNFVVKGDYGVFVKEADHSPHFYVRSARPSIESKGKLDFDVVRILDTEEDGLIREIVAVGTVPSRENDDWKDTIEYLVSLIFKKANVILFDGIDIHARRHLMYEIIPASKGDC